MNRRNYLRFALYPIVIIGFSVHAASAYVEYFRAVNVDNIGVVKDLLARGFDPNSPNDKGQVALFLAMRDEAPRVAELLLAHPQIKVDATTASDETPLMMAALKGNREWTLKLLERGAALNRPGWTPLHYAASGPETALVRLLLERGAEINALAPNGNTPLMMAAGYGAQDSADLLLARGADARVRNRAGLSAADFAQREGREKLALRLETAAR